jgi:hypothetical protein
LGLRAKTGRWEPIVVCISVPSFRRILAQYANSYYNSFKNRNKASGLRFSAKVNVRLGYLQSADFAMKFNPIGKRPGASLVRIYGIGPFWW